MARGAGVAEDQERAMRLERFAIKHGRGFMKSEDKALPLLFERRKDALLHPGTTPADVVKVTVTIREKP